MSRSAYRLRIECLYADDGDSIRAAGTFSRFPFEFSAYDGTWHIVVYPAGQDQFSLPVYSASVNIPGGVALSEAEAEDAIKRCYLHFFSELLRADAARSKAAREERLRKARAARKGENK
jgi:hypothetical protein